MWCPPALTPQKLVWALAAWVPPRAGSRPELRPTAGDCRGVAEAKLQPEVRGPRPTGRSPWNRTRVRSQRPTVSLRDHGRSVFTPRGSTVFRGRKELLHRAGHGLGAGCGKGWSPTCNPTGRSGPTVVPTPGRCLCHGRPGSAQIRMSLLSRLWKERRPRTSSVPTRKGSGQTASQAWGRARPRSRREQTLFLRARWGHQETRALPTALPGSPEPAAVTEPQPRVHPDQARAARHRGTRSPNAPSPPVTTLGCPCRAVSLAGPRLSALHPFSRGFSSNPTWQEPSSPRLCKQGSQRIKNLPRVPGSGVGT